MIEEIYSFEKYENYIRTLAADPNFSDPHFLYNEENLYESLKDKSTRAFVVKDSLEISGLFVFLILEEEKYIEMLVGFSKSESAIRQILDFLESTDKDYQLDFVINPKNIAFRKVLEERSAKFFPEQVKMVWKKDPKISLKASIITLPKDLENEYIKVHRTDTYWTGQRILEARDKFRVFLALEGGKIIGYLDITYSFEENEPYDLWVQEKYKNQGYEQALLAAAIQMNKPHRLMVLVDADKSEEIKIYEDVGFELVQGQNSSYVSYKA